MEITVQQTAHKDVREVQVSGDITLDESRPILTRLWADPDYAKARAALWNISTATLLSFEHTLNLSTFIVREKAGRGPAIIAIVSPAFANSLVAQTFRGFERMVGLDLSFFDNLDEARTWILRRLAASRVGQ
jgi:hypothetical protein